MSSEKIVVDATALEGILTKADQDALSVMKQKYDVAMKDFAVLQAGPTASERASAERRLISSYDEMGKLMREISEREGGRLSVYSFQQPRESHGEASRLIAKLRDVRTQHEEFVYYIQRAYELLFNQAFSVSNDSNKHHLIVTTPVTHPVQNYAVHKLPNVEQQLNKCVMCVLLRGALLPSMIMSKEIQEYSSSDYVTPFALFRIKRNEARHLSDMQYILDLNNSYFDPASLDGKDLVFADPMNATGGSVVTIIKYLHDIGIVPRSVICFNVISALQGSLQVIRAIDKARVFTLWMDPVLNDLAYIMPGLGDAGDRLNGKDREEAPRNIIQLLADYGTNITNLYRAQMREIERTVLGVKLC